MNETADRNKTPATVLPASDPEDGSWPRTGDASTDRENRAGGAGAGKGRPDSSESGEPRSIGRYRVIRILGRGTFGQVYLAHDDDLDRPVAIKVPNPERVAGPADVESYLAEARTLARLDHPHIVPVCDLGRTDDGLCYVVSKYVAGSDLAERLRAGRLTFRQSAELVAIVAEALHHAHARGLVHRDLKPANILIDEMGRPCVADFGLALRDENYGTGTAMAGTPAYMSPEQARSEGHRVDGRSDIFSLGVVFYELLTSRRPFRGISQPELLEQIQRAEERPPRQIDDAIPRELERICQRMLAKRASERYGTAGDLADDLRHFLHTDTEPATPPPAPAPPVPIHEAAPAPPTPPRADSSGLGVKVVPKGLRSFDRTDADFFLELLPGARDRDGLPESVRFWKTRIEAADPDLAFRVGLIYGPSGCGKSSLVKAGLLPRLAEGVLAVYIEATAAETEARLLRGIRKVCPGLPADRGLVDALAALRRGWALEPGEKVLLVLDQFEQWLFARRGEEDTELVAALRHCDGGRVQAIVMVRDDFWMATSRFMQDLEIDLTPNANIALIDLFGPRHARKVLAAFGRAYGALPERSSELTKDHEAFLDQAITGLAQDGKVISVRLALFAEMVKEKKWAPSTLRDVGGIEGVGVTFLEETFASPQANPRHRLHQKGAQAVLKALLPRKGTDIKGQMRPESELRAASGYADRPRDFDELVRILDQDLRLITPTDLEGSSDEIASAARGSDRFFQLTHDYLVPSLRDWLTRKQRETRRGRAELRLADRAALWEAKPENRHLPSVFEWARIRSLTRRKDWTDPQRRMMRRAGRFHGLRAMALAALIALGTWGGVEAYGHLHSAELVASLETAGTADVPRIVERLARYRRWADPKLVRMLGETEPSSRAHLHARLALLLSDASQVDPLYESLIAASPADLRTLVHALESHKARLAPRLWSELEKAGPGDPSLLASAGALAVYDPGNPRWSDLGGKVARALVSLNPILVGQWLEPLRPVSGKLTAPLEAILHETSRPESEHDLATSILADYAKDEPDRLAGMLMVSEPKSFLTLFPVVERQAAGTIPVFQAELARIQVTREKADTEPAKDELAERQARAAVALVRLGRADEVWPLLRHSTDPRLRSFIVNWLAPLGADPKAIAAALSSTSVQPVESKGHGLESRATSHMDRILFHLETSKRRALILALGTYGTDGLSPAEREPLTPRLLDLYEHDPDAGIHAAAGWTLRQRKQQKKLAALDASLSKLKDRGDRRWSVNGQGQTFALIEGPLEFRMGSPPDEPDRTSDLEPHRQPIPYRFAIAAKEVSVADYQKFVGSAKENQPFGLDRKSLDRYSPDPTGPMIGVNWYGAVAYCNWLSEREGIPKDQWCYEPNQKGEYAEGMKIKADALKLLGYRLPTEAEWEYSCRAGTLTSRYHGFSVGLLRRYARYEANSGDHAWPGGSLLPNDLGLFDMLGNAYEWCPERYTDNPSRASTDSYEHINESHRLLRGGSFNYRPAVVRSAYRNRFAPSVRDANCGFRLARTYD